MRARAQSAADRGSYFAARTARRRPSGGASSRCPPYSHPAGEISRPRSCCRGTSPSQAAKLRPFEKAPPSPIAATQAVAEMGPTPRRAVPHPPHSGQRAEGRARVPPRRPGAGHRASRGHDTRSRTAKSSAATALTPRSSWGRHDFVFRSRQSAVARPRSATATRSGSRWCCPDGRRRRGSPTSTSPRRERREAACRDKGQDHERGYGSLTGSYT